MIKEYLKHAVRIESLVLEQKQVVSYLQRTINELNNYSYEKKQNIYSKTDSIGFALPVGIIAGMIGATLGFFSHVFSFENLFDVSMMLSRVIKSALVWSLPSMGITVVISWIVILFKNKSSSAQNSIVERNNKATYEVNSTKIQKLTRELETARKNLKTITDTRARLYARNVIHAKYRNLVAVCSFYEYFDTGRCSSLEGHEGAYNIYETEIRLNRIICQLDEVLQELDQIKNTQRELYDAVNQCNRNISNLNGHLESIAYSSQQIAANSAITAYNSTIAARNSEEIRWIMRSN